MRLLLRKQYRRLLIGWSYVRLLVVILVGWIVECQNQIVLDRREFCELGIGIVLDVVQLCRFVQIFVTGLLDNYVVVQCFVLLCCDDVDVFAMWMCLCC